MIPFLPLLGWMLGGFLSGFLVGLVIDYLDKQTVKKHIQQQEKKKFTKEISKCIGDLLYDEERTGGLNVGFKDTLSNPYKDRNNIINSLVSNYGYDIELVKNKPLSRLQEMIIELEGSKNGGIDWILEDEESRRLFAGKYLNGEVVSMEEIQAQEIDPELQWELDTQEIVIL